MSAYTYKITFEVERESGLFASRDEISDLIEEALSEAGANLSLSGVGPNSDSEYTHELVEVEYLTKKDERNLLKEYDEFVATETPTLAEMRKEMSVLRRKIALQQRQLELAAEKLQKRTEENDQNATRIWYKSSGDRDELKTYIPDGKYDYIRYQVNPDDDLDTIEVRFFGGRLEIRNNMMGSGLALYPRSGNEVVVTPGDPKAFS